MAVLIADPALLSYLTPMKERTEIRDSNGKLLGVFTPERVDYSEVRKLFDPEEIKRRKERSQNDPGRTLDQIMERLRSLENGA